MRRSRAPQNTLQALIICIVFVVIGMWKLLMLFFKVFGVFIGHIVLLLNRQKCNNQYIDFEKVDNMDGLSFEHYVASLLQGNGYKNVRVTRASGDFGVDILANKNQLKWAFQCKCYCSKLGVHAIQEIYSGAAKYGADMSVVVTNNYFTPAAIEMAKDLSVQLWDREVLGSLMNKTVNEDKLCSRDTKTGENKLCIEHALTDDIEFKETHKEAENAMATMLSAGKYVFGEDIPMGKYNLKAVFGDGTLVIQTGDEDGDDTWINFGCSTDYAREYKNLSLKKGWFFSLDGNLQVEITKSKMIEIED